MKRIILVTIFAAFMPVGLIAQSAATFHVFPQIADGNLNDGSFYSTSIFATNVNTQAATCTLRLYGVPASRLDTKSTVTLPARGSIALMATAGNGSPLAAGYATLTCDRPVHAFATYLFSSALGLTLSGASVFSSPPTTRAQLIVLNLGRFRSALAIANDTDSVARYQLAVIDIEASQTVATTTITVPARSNLPRFLDEMFPLPKDFVGSVVITSSSTPFSLVGLLYIDAAFLSQPAAIY